jgi:hypothetical protein
MSAGSGGLSLNRSRLARELDLPSIDPMIVPPSIAREIAGGTQDFWERQLAQGKLLGVTYLPGFAWMHTRILEAWFEAVPSSVLKTNRTPDWREQLLWRQSPFLFRRNDWLKSYARALTNHALTTGYLVVSASSFDPSCTHQGGREPSSKDRCCHPDEFARSFSD